MSTELVTALASEHRILRLAATALLAVSHPVFDTGAPGRVSPIPPVPVVLPRIKA